MDDTIIDPLQNEVSANSTFQFKNIFSGLLDGIMSK